MGAVGQEEKKDVVMVVDHCRSARSVAGRGKGGNNVETVPAGEDLEMSVPDRGDTFSEQGTCCGDGGSNPVNLRWGRRGLELSCRGCTLKPSGISKVVRSG